MADQSHYEVLGVSRTASEKEVVQAYRILVRQHHPDRVGPSGEQITMLLNFAYDVLSDPAQRRDYDRGLPPDDSMPPPPTMAWGDQPPAPGDFVDPPPPSGASTAPAPTSSEVSLPSLKPAPWAAPPLPKIADPEPSAPWTENVDDWTPGIPEQSYQMQEPAPATAKQDLVRAFPPGSRPRVVCLALSASSVVAGLGVALLSGDEGAALWVLLSMFGGLLLLKQHPHWASYVITAAIGGVGGVGVSMSFMATPLGGAGLILAALSWTALSVSMRGWKKFRRRHAEARTWRVIKNVAEAIGDGPLWVKDTERGQALLEDPVSGLQRSVTVWGEVTASSWVVLNAAGNVVGSAPGSAFQSWEWVEKDSVKREAKDAGGAR